MMDSYCNYCGSQGNMMGPCACGLFDSQTSSFSMSDEADMYPYSSSSSSYVDCTLSLGTPSTRLTNDNEKRVHRDRRPSFMSNFFGKTPSSPQNQKSSRGSTSSSSSSNSGGDPLLARRCANCDTTSTPLWRNGPKGPKSLCNACGIRFKKEERRATAAAAAASTNGGGAAMDPQHVMNSSWVYQSQAQHMPYYSPAYGNEFSYTQDDDSNTDNGMSSFVSWHRPSFVHDFTR